MTARKRTETLQDIPSSVAALGAEQLGKLGADSLEEFAGQTPGLSLTGNRDTHTVLACTHGRGAFRLNLDAIFIDGFDGN